jgi:hypothetical protein
MKKSKIVTLVLITSALATACKKENHDWESTGRKVYTRSDTTAPYSRTHYRSHGSGIGMAYVWYRAFRPYGMMGNDGNYHRAGYYSNAMHSSSNVGRNSTKMNISRGGFGRSGFSVHS